MVAHLFTVLALRRSILTEKVARRGFHLTREYSIDPLEILFVREVMRHEVVVLPLDTSVARAAAVLEGTTRAQAQRLYPVVDGAGALVGVATRTDIEAAAADGAKPLASIMHARPVVAHGDEPLRAAIHRMAESGLTRMPVVDRSEPPKLLGLVTLKGALKARVRHLEEERRRERVLPISLIVPRWLRSIPSIPPSGRLPRPSVPSPVEGDEDR
jgi:CBS domain-containing protein